MSLHPKLLTSCLPNLPNLSSQIYFVFSWMAVSPRLQVHRHHFCVKELQSLKLQLRKVN